MKSLYKVDSFKKTILGIEGTVQHWMTRNLEFVNGMGSLMACDLPITREVYTISQSFSLKIKMSINELKILEMST